MSIVGRLDRYASMLAWEFDETTANNPKITGLGTYYASEFSENVGIQTTITANVFAPYDPVYDEFSGTLFGAGQGRYMRQNNDKSVIVYNEIDEVTDFYGRGIVRDGLVLDLDASSPNNYNETTLYDLSGYNHAGLSNGALPNSSTGSVVFDGIDDYASGTFSSPINNNYYSVDWWIYPTQFLNYNQHVGFSSYSDTSPWDHFVVQSDSTGGIYAGTRLTSRLTPGYSGMPTMTLNTWQNFTFVNNNGFVDLYKNGIRYISAYNNGVATETGLFYSLGVTPSGGASNGLIKGRISNIRVYNGKSLTSTEVSQNYNALRGRFGL